jgi:hypothetical protein
MKDRDFSIVRKILHYCAQIEEAMLMFNNDFETFKS